MMRGPHKTSPPTCPVTHGKESSSPGPVGARGSKKGDPVWEAYAGMAVFDCGKRRNGKSRRVLAVTTIRVFSAADAKALRKAEPGLKFVLREKD